MGKDYIAEDINEIALVLSRSKSLTNLMLKQSWDIFGDIKEIYKYLFSSDHHKRKKISHPEKEQIQKELSFINQNNLHLIYFGHPLYPSSLMSLKKPPFSIIAKGNVNLLKNNLKKIGIVGTRNPCLPSSRLCQKITTEIQDAEIITVSGLAKGIDSLVHQNSFTRGTIAVLGTGIDICYPIENQTLYDTIIAKNGCIISQFPCGTKPLRYNFPERNAVIAGLSSGILICEAKEQSGSLITAKEAMKINRKIFSVPGFPLDDRFSGNNRLISEQKAEIYISTSSMIKKIFSKQSSPDSDIFNLNHPKNNEYMNDNGGSGRDAAQAINKSRDHIEDIKSQIPNLLSSMPVSINAIINSLQSNTVYVNIALLELELADAIQRDQNGDYFI